MLLERAHMFRRVVSFVPRQAVLGIDVVPDAHAGVAFDFRDDGSRGDRMAPRVAVNQRVLRDDEIERHCVDQQKIRSGYQFLNGEPHRQTRGLIDIDPVDRRRIHCRYGPCRRPFANAFR